MNKIYHEMSEDIKKRDMKKEAIESRKEKHVIVKQNENIGNKWSWVKQYKDSPLSIVYNEGYENYAIALGTNIITERRFENVEETEKWLEKPTENGEFPWKEIIVIGIITSKEK